MKYIYLKLLFWLSLSLCNLTYAFEKEFNSPVTITSNNLVVDQNKKIATFSENVQAIQNDVIIKAGKMIAHYDNNENKISKIELIENIIITRQDQIAKGEQGLYDLLNNKIELNNNVILIKGNNMLKGNNLLYDMNTGEAKIFSKDSKKSHDKIKAIFVPNDNDRKS